MDLGNQDMKKNSCKKYYKNILNKDYEGIFDNKLKSIREKLFLNVHLAYNLKRNGFWSSRVSHLLHVRKCRGIFLYRPVSIAREWSLSLNLQTNLISKPLFNVAIDPD
jgi:hypothetical protein